MYGAEVMYADIVETDDGYIGMINWFPRPELPPPPTDTTWGGMKWQYVARFCAIGDERREEIGKRVEAWAEERGIRFTWLAGHAPTGLTAREISATYNGRWKLEHELALLENG